MTTNSNNKGKVLAIIPARGGSKGLPRKNILPLNDKPVLAYTAESALGAKTLDRIILSTDSLEIAEIGREYGVEVPFLRPEELSGDLSHPTATLTHALEFLEKEDGYRPDIVVLLQPTSPLRGPEHIDEVVSLLQYNSDMDSAITVQEVILSPYWMVRRDNAHLRPFVDDGVDYSLIRRQDLKEVYKPNGAVYASRTQLLLDQGVIFSTFSGGNTGYVIMTQMSSLEIDTETDFLVIEAVLKGKVQI